MNKQDRSSAHYVKSIDNLDIIFIVLQVFKITQKNLVAFLFDHKQIKSKLLTP